ncbi:NAD(+)/NADH kinase [Priestia megaterium]|uniref:NAD(+)/NADH kinase n=1 Tax=Priestia megaterium TaxID=1404 RepID=UPI0035D7E78E
MRTISIYNNDLKDNKERREILTEKIKKSGFGTGREGEFMFVIGGDGTFLKAIQRNMKTNPIFIGINTGNLGFLSEFTFNDVDRIVDMIKKKEYQLETIQIYEAIVTMKNQVKRLYFVNDLVVKEFDDAIHLGLHINDEKIANISGDGIIVSTHLGSTAYNLSAGGPLNYDGTNILSITPLVAMHNKKYKSLTKSIILENKNEVTINPYHKKGRPIRLICDGNRIKATDIRSISIKKSPFSVKMLRSPNYNFTGNIVEKILNNE